MSNWRLHTPEGTTDLLPDQCMRKNELENDILNVFGSYGYDAVEIPVMQFYDVYDTPAGKIEQEIMYKFFDRGGRITVLRPDITTAIARMVATKMTDGHFPKRLCYCGKVFRQIDSYSSGQREFCQAGIELIGAGGDEADAEAVLCAAEALLSAGLDEFLIELGQVEFFKGLVEQAGLCGEEAEELRVLVDKKDTLAIREFLEKKSIDAEVKKLIISLPGLFGEPDILEKIDTAALCPRSAAALSNLRRVCGILDECGYLKYISIDLSLVQGISCYTGIIFRGITSGVGFSVCTGGRYDTLLGEYGCDLPAVGMAIGTDRLLNVLSAGEEEPHAAADILMAGGSFSARFKTATALRNAGYVVEDYLLCDGGEREYAASAHIHGVLSLDGSGGMTIYNIHDKSETKTDVGELLGQSEEAL